jgi:hypothetical protein
MGYQQALEKAWSTASNTQRASATAVVSFLADSYTINFKDRSILSDACNIPAKEHVAILLLHYLIRKDSPSPIPAETGEWIDFRELAGGEGYYPAFKKRTIDRIISKYGRSPDSINDALTRIPGILSDKSDIGIILRPMKEIPILITISKADDEFGPDASILFEKNISEILCTEDIVVLTELLIHAL